MYEDCSNHGFPESSETSKKLIGQPGHDSDSAWDRFCRAYCPPGAAFLKKRYPNDIAHIDDAIQKTLLRIRKELGLHYDWSRFRLKNIFCKRLNDKMFDDLKKRRKLLERDTNAYNNSATLGQPTRKDAGNPLQDLTDETAVEIHGEIVSGRYKRMEYADALDNQEVLIWKYLVQGVKGVDIVRRVGDGCTSTRVTRVKEKLPEKIVKLARERIIRNMRLAIPPA